MECSRTSRAMRTKPNAIDEQSDAPKSRIGRFMMVSVLAATSVIAGVRQGQAAVRSFRLCIPTTKRDLLRRSVVRIGFCALPFLLVAWLCSVYRDGRLLHGWWLWWCVVVIPTLGLALDTWRLWNSPGGRKTILEQVTAPNKGPAASVDNSKARRR